MQTDKQNSSIDSIEQKEHIDYDDLHRLHLDTYPDIALTRFLNVDYVHLKTAEGGDLYVTRHGLPFLEFLRPENWYSRKWFKANRQRLQGTSTVYKVISREIDGKSLELVVKWSRVGQDVPLETKIIEDVLNAEFNSPFEEFSLVEELRSSNGGLMNNPIMLQKPLAIYAPPEKLQLWQTGRSRHKIMSKIAKHSGVVLDILRQYILIYKWVRGIDAVEANEQRALTVSELESFTKKVIGDLRTKGYRVLDQKPAHFIVRLRPDGTMMRPRRKPSIPYTLIDFELLERTPEYETKVKATRRRQYLQKQRDRFQKKTYRQWPQHLHTANIMGVDYVSGPTESTNGMLWVVGNDPDLFDYFQPERWRKTPRTTLSPTDEVYYTKTKDNINIVWKVSKVGEKPAPERYKRMQKIIQHGYNSPFEEFSLAFQLSGQGLPTVYPRAIYMTGTHSDGADITDDSRFESHSSLLTPEGRPILRKDHDYITVWGFWNGLDESLAEHDGEYVTGINALNAFRRGLITEDEYLKLMRQVRDLLGRRFSVEDLALKGNHVLLSLTSGGRLIRNKKQKLEIRYCNFEMIKRREQRSQ